jgi:8-amino-7-oxononanoate synthase
LAKKFKGLKLFMWNSLFNEQSFDYPRQLSTIQPKNNHIQNENINFASNDYLGVNTIPSIRDAWHTHMCDLLKENKVSMGATGSRLLSGNTSSHVELEKLIAKTKGSEAALIFNSGYQANSTVLTTLLKCADINKISVFTDKLNHASLHYAFEHINLRQIRYQHNNLAHLKIRLQKHIHDNSLACITTESVFGMDGDMLKMSEIMHIAKKYQALLYIDEAHATGVYGHNGYGLTTNLFKNHESLVVMGTFSKALGASGGYIACSHAVKNYLLNTCGGFIYSTALSPLLVEAVYYIWQQLQTHAFMQLRQNIHNLSAYARQEIQKLEFNIGTTESHIIPIILGNIGQAQKLHAYLLKNHIQTNLIKPPTVAANASRIRISICAYHSQEDVAQLITHLKYFKEYMANAV